MSCASWGASATVHFSWHHGVSRRPPASPGWRQLCRRQEAGTGAFISLIKNTGIQMQGLGWLVHCGSLCSF